MTRVPRFTALLKLSHAMKNQEKPLGQGINVKKEDIYFNLLIKGLRNQVASFDLIC